MNRLISFLAAICLSFSFATAASPTRTDHFIVASPGSTPQASGPSPSRRTPGNFVEQLCAGGDATAPWRVDGWANYQRLWQELAADPQNETLRRYLGLPIGGASQTQWISRSSRGRSAPRWLRWRPGSYLQVETPHLQIFSHADEATTVQVAEDLERVYWAWTQLFFPLWEARDQVALHLDRLSADDSIAAQLAGTNVRLSTRPKLRIVLLKDARDYAQTLGASVPGIGQSTGFYSDERQTSFFYPADTSDSVASRRHELVHQLFRQATPSRLTTGSPGMSAGFWLVEGIAGFFESLHFDGDVAKLGGWDSPRLQFARYRVFALREVVPFADLRSDGRDAVQRRADLARFYAFAIGYTHCFLNGPNSDARRWVYQRLAELYEIRLDVPAVAPPQQAERDLVGFLRVDDATVTANRPRTPLTTLCLASCEVGGKGLSSIAPAKSLAWLDLSQLPIDGNVLRQLVPDPKSLRQLSLEGTRIDDGLADWLAGADQLTELDLSGTRCGNRTVAAIQRHRSLRTLWLTGTRIGDAAIDELLQLPAIESIDLQRTQVTPAGIARLKDQRPGWNINPL